VPSSRRYGTQADVRVRQYFGGVSGQWAVTREPSGHVGCVRRTARRRDPAQERVRDAEPTAGQGLLLYRYAIPAHLCKLNDFELTSAVTPPATAARPPVAQGAASWWVVAGQQPPSKRRPAHGPMDS